MVLADDLDGNGRLNLVVSTMNGNVYAFETPSAFHPLKAWPSQVCVCKRRGAQGLHAPCGTCYYMGCGRIAYPRRGTEV